MINENKIREACSSDRERGFKMLMNSFQVPIYNYIRRMVVSHEDAEDVLQEVFIRVFRHLDQFRNEASGQGIDAGNPDDFIFSVEVRDGLF